MRLALTHRHAHGLALGISLVSLWCLCGVSGVSLPCMRLVLTADRHAHCLARSLPPLSSAHLPRRPVRQRLRRRHNFWGGKSQYI